MKTYMPTYRDKKTGKKKKCSHYYLTFVDNRQIRRRLPAYSDKRATETLGIQVQNLLDSGGVLNQEQKRWFAGLIPKVRDKLIEFCLVDERSTSNHLVTPLTEHLRVFCESLAADNRKPYYIKQTGSSIRRILNGCKLKVWSDIDGNNVKVFLAKGRGPEGYGERTYNSHLRAFKMFCGWLKSERGLSPDPMGGHKLIKQVNFRKVRRPLKPDEIKLLLKATIAGKMHHNMTGCERSLIYCLATETGARFGEIKKLKVSSFNFDANPCTVRIDADCKGKKPDDLLLFPETAAAIQKCLSNKEPQDTAFNMPHRANAANMIRKDLAAAGIEYRDAAGRDVDFHSLRHSYCSNLALAGVHPTVAQKLARHSSIEITMRYYTHVLHESEVSAIDALHDLSYACQKHVQKQTTMDSSGQKNRDNDTKTRLSA